MSQGVYELMMCGGLGGTLSLVAGLLMRRWWLSSLFAAGLTALIVPLYAVAANGWRVRPSDVAFWLPLMAMWAGVYAAPMTFAVGLLLHVIRKRKTRV